MLCTCTDSASARAPHGLRQVKLKLACWQHVAGLETVPAALQMLLES